MQSVPSATSTCSSFDNDDAMGTPNVLADGGTPVQSKRSVPLATCDCGASSIPQPASNASDGPFSVLAEFLCDEPATFTSTRFATPVDGSNTLLDFDNPVNVTSRSQPASFASTEPATAVYGSNTFLDLDNPVSVAPRPQPASFASTEPLTAVYGSNTFQNFANPLSLAPPSHRVEPLPQLGM